jgi:endonuclease G
VRIVLVHGRAAEMEIPSTMLRDWTDALLFGLTRINAKVNPDALDVRLAYYGDIWRPDLRQPLPKIQPVPEAEEGFAPLNEISLWVDEHLGIGDALLEHLLHDVDDYFSDRDLRRLTNGRLTTAITTELPAKERVIVVGFSMGSLVAYDTLRTDAALAVPLLPVAGLLTIGSPLAMPSFYRRILASGPEPKKLSTPYPPQLDLWANIWTKDDPAVAGHVDMTNRYPGDPRNVGVQDLETWGRSMSPTNPAAAHNATDYMSSRVFAKALDTALAVIASQ